jgi:hypothetical protein
MAGDKWLTKLPDDLVAQLPAIRDEWLRHGLSTQPADRERAEAGVEHAYRAANLTPPKVVVWLRSPLEGVIASAMFKDQVAAQVRVKVGSQVWDQVGDQVADQVWDQVADQVWDQVWNQVWTQVRDRVWNQVWDQVRAQVWDQAGVYAIYGSQDASWLSFYRVFRSAGVEAAKRLDGLSQVATSAGWWWPFKQAVILTERPCHLHRDDQYRLHNDKGLAIAYPDGWGVYAWHGIRVPADVILKPETITVETIHAEENIEIKRAMIERIGWDRYFEQTHATAVHTDAYGTLYRTRVGEVDCAVVVVRNSTPEPDGRVKRYGIQVGLDVSTAHEAVASTFGLTAKTYRPEVQS